MNKPELKKQFEFYCSLLVKNNDMWDFYFDALDINEKTTQLFEPKMKYLLELLNKDDKNLLDMETDDIFDLLFTEEKTD